MIKRLVCLIGALVGGTALSQAPEYTQQYSQRLAGAVDELQAVIMRFDEDAAAFGLSREEGLARYQGSPDTFLSARGISMQQVFERYQALSAQLAELRSADSLTRLTSLVSHFDTDVGAAAWADFRPAVPVTFEGAAYALVGVLVGYLLAWGGSSAVAAPFRHRRSRVKITRTEPRL